MLIEFARRADRNNAAVIHDRKPVAQPLGLFHEMRGEQQRFATQRQLPQTFPDHMPCLRIEAGGGFVEKQHVGIVDQRARQCQSSFHAARQRLDARIAARRKPGIFKQIRDALFQFCVGDAEIAAIHQQVFAYGEIGIEVVQLRHHAHACTGIARARRYVVIEQGDAAAVGVRQPQQQSQGGGFARAIGAEQAKTFAGHEFEVDARDGFVPVV